ncbi:adenylate/guanylate cyclase domain-containing protein [Nocardioides perillae]|uniref:Adenylate cyclase n=1 Tax=Nocardioides perillae TaxID=1119534 RepID=A0A7Y9RPQ1_9ACTN|nr:adenylate cyclase [Nocardioides perillae]
MEQQLLGQVPHLTRLEVSERSGVPLTVAAELWRLLGFPQLADDEVAFTDGDVEALRTSSALYEAGVIGPESQAALVRTWGRSFARLAEWQVDLLTQVVVEAADSGADPVERLTAVASDVLPRLEALQAYTWRRHLAAAAGRVLSDGRAGATDVALPTAVGFVDIVGYTTRSKELDEAELVAWLEAFEDRASGVVLEHGGRIIKTIGDEVLYVADSAADAAAAAWELTRIGADEDDPFPAVRAGVAYGEVVARLGDVYGPTVNVAARLTSHARPGSVIVDRGAHDVLCPDHAPPGPDGEPPGPWRLKRLSRTSVKGYARLESWVLREPRG